MRPGRIDEVRRVEVIGSRCKTGSKVPGQLIGECLLREEEPVQDESGPEITPVDNEIIIEKVEMIEQSGRIEHPNGDLPRQFRCGITWSDDSVTIRLFVFLRSGGHRTVYASGDVNGWVVKIQQVMATERNYNKEEWLRDRNTSVVPKLYGYTEEPHRGGTLSFVFTDRIGFTLVEMIRKLVVKQFDDTTVRLVAKGVEMLVKMQIPCAREGCWQKDWELGNVGFADTEAGELKMIKIVERRGTKSKSTPDLYRESMESYLKQVKHLSKYTACNPNWHTALIAISKCTEEWWASWAPTLYMDDELPNEGDAKQLSDALCSVVQEMSSIALVEVQRNKEELDGRDHGVPGRRISVELVGKRKREESGVVRDTHPTICDDSGPHSSCAGPNNMAIGVRGDSAKTQGYVQELTSTIGEGRFRTRVGRAAARALLAEWKGARLVLETQRFHEGQMYRRGIEAYAVRSIPLELRIVEPCIFHELHGAPSRSVEEGNDLGLLFRLFLNKIKERRYTERMTHMPRACRNPIRFHQTYWTQFATSTYIPWLKMSAYQKQCHLHKFLRKKFSMDRKCKVMFPDTDRRRKGRNAACWEGFWLTDSEVDSIVSDVMEEYQQMRHQQ
jgi:hypothetical protein